ncbi:MAG: hypothetical protein HLUCCO17_12975 [Saliniramus fredricksonii]|uniref:Uncharacterized protein n=2 Tax=Saliniramus fredricksonii TaxID=1653334 RepID=A0A0P7X4M2_9HYPH|nr:MAG: hypothetical protein HLUCCO17_12975 [Saliniramus fredricksonii]SCC82122.1 hypothetical protein GA0071312_3098 [Saliniramus fredricksonii]
MSELMVLERTSRVHDNGALRDQGGSEEFRSAISGSMQQSGAVPGATSDQGAFPSDQAEVYAQGYLAGLRDAGLNDAGPHVADPTMMTGGGGRVGDLDPDAMGFDADRYAMRSPEVDALSGMQGMGPGVSDELAGAILFLERMMQLVTMLERLSNQPPGGSQSGGMQFPDMMTPGGPGFDPRGNPEMSIRPGGDHAGNVADSIPLDERASVSGGQDVNLTPYQRDVNEATRTGEGSIPLITETPPSEEGYMAGPFSYDDLNEILDYAMQDPTAMREATFAELSARASDRGAPDNIVTAYEELFDLLDAGDEEGFRNAFLNLGHTDLGEFPVWGAVDVADSVRREEEGGAPSNPALDDLDGNIADGLPIDMNASEDLATQELATEDMLEEEVG